MPRLAQLTSAAAPIQAPRKRPTAADLALGEAGASPPRSRGLYVHVPFCFHKCHYCDFYSVVDSRGRQAAFAARLVEELGAARQWLARPLDTIFVGGGTPTLLEPSLWGSLLAELAPLLGEAEFTVEANPETVTAELAATLAAGGVNRMSVGAQSFDPAHLATLERIHDPAAVGRSLRLIRDAGIANVNIDLIFAIPGQDLDGWRADLERALALEPDHLSCYGLTYEPNTPLAARLRAGAVERADEDLEAGMYETAIETLAGAGYEHYEISNWARPGRRCRHNVLYWTDGSWWPLGPGAAGHVAGSRWKNAPRLDEYLASRGLPPITEAVGPDDDREVGEALMMGLRLIDGIALDRLEALLSRGGGGGVRAAAIERHVEAGLLGCCGGRLRLTPRGLLLADTVLADLI